MLLKGLLQRDQLPEGCRFAPRCEYAEDRCAAERQVLTAAGPGHRVACRRRLEIPPLALYAMALAQVVEHESRFARFRNSEDHKLVVSYQKLAMQLGRKLGLVAAAGALATFRRQADDHIEKLSTLAKIEEADADGLLARPQDGPIRH